MGRRPPGRWLTGVAAVALLAGTAARAQILDDFEEVSGWSAVVSDPGIRVELARDQGVTGMALRIDFNFESSGGHVLVRKPFAVDLPRNYAFSFAWRAEAPPLDTEFKLIDASERNVWWYRQFDTRLPTDWTRVRIKKPRILFAWGPASGGAPRNIGYIELAITGVAGDRGSLWIDDLRLEERAAPPRSPAAPTISASTSLSGHPADAVLDNAIHTSWQSGALAAEQWLQLDFGAPREYGGLVIDWSPDDYAVGYDVEASDDGETWRTAYRSTHGRGQRDHIYLPDGESHYIRLALHRSSRGQGYAISSLRVIPLELATSPNHFMEEAAKDAPPGTYPRYFSQRQTYWTVVGVPGDDRDALLSDDGMLEVERGGFSIQPFLFTDNTLVSWHNVDVSQELEGGYLPIPSVSWRYGFLSMRITALATGAAGQSVLLVRYLLDNSSDTVRDVTLYLAAWPFQVLPPWQTLNMVGGVSPIYDLTADGRALWVNRRTAVIGLTPPTGIGATTSDEGPIGDFLSAGVLPQRASVSDPYGFASAAMQFEMHLPPGAQQAVYIAVPLHDPEAMLGRSSGAGPEAEFTRAFDDGVRDWRRLLGCVEFTVPPAAQDLVRAVKSTLAYILINRDGPAIQPGSRTYARSWIRDGAMTSALLLEMGFPGEVRDFVRWYADYQYATGRVPCCVDRHGADPLPENDSNGEFLYAIAEYYRYTRDIGFVNELWPNVRQAVDYIATLRGERTTEAYTAPGKQLFYGLLPESVSHEGYVARPVHSYWDDFFALRGLKDAVVLAQAVGEEAEALRIAALRDAFQRDVHASIAGLIETRALDYLPASVELADFDPSSTVIAITPGGELARLPPVQTRHTFQRYYDEMRRRSRGEIDWDAYAPYEMRTVGAFIRLGEREQALAVLQALLADRRPLAWNQWPEIVWRDAATPKFIGDMPHTWVGSGFAEAVRDLFAYEREDDRALVLGAGIPSEWIAGELPVGIRRLPTHYGILTYTLRREGPTSLRLRLSGDLDVPAGGIIVQPPLPAPLVAVNSNGHPVPFEAREARIDEFPAEVLLEYAPPETATPQRATEAPL